MRLGEAVWGPQRKDKEGWKSEVGPGVISSLAAQFTNSERSIRALLT